MRMQIRFIDVIVGLLVVQFILGMVSNMYATVPEDKPYLIFHDPGFIFFHAWNAVLLVILGVIFLVKAIRRKQRVALAAFGLTGLVVAYADGVSFVFTQRDYFSLIMALGFLVAFASYLTAAVKSGTRANPS